MPLSQHKTGSIGKHIGGPEIETYSMHRPKFVVACVNSYRKLKTAKCLFQQYGYENQQKVEDEPKAKADLSIPMAQGMLKS